jgi:hypothetical protein
MSSANWGSVYVGLKRYGIMKKAIHVGSPLSTPRRLGAYLPPPAIEAFGRARLAGACRAVEIGNRTALAVDPESHDKPRLGVRDYH